jgi:16S rRNA processing protein RimM
VGAPGPGELVVIGRLGRPHGLRGELGARPTGPTLEALDPGAAVTARRADGEERALRLIARRGPPERPILAFAGLVTREDAAALAGATLLVPPAALPSLEDPEAHYVRDLIGVLVLVGDRPLGPITEIHPGPAHDTLEVGTAEGPVLVPFTADAVVELDAPGRRLVVRPGLLAEPGEAP